MSRSWSLLVVVAIVAVATNSWAQTDQADEQGTLIPIGPDHGRGHDHDPGQGHDRGHGNDQGHDHNHDHGQDHGHNHGHGESASTVSRYWIGIAGGPVPLALRSHLRIGREQGVMVRKVSVNSPAAEGGFEKYDVIVRVNGDPISSMRQFAHIVADQGKMKGQLAVEVIRHGQNETVYVTPLEKTTRRELAPSPRRNGSRFGRPSGGQAFKLNINRDGDTPGKITVQSGDQTWELDMNDPDSLAQLPEGLRPLVEQTMAEGPAVGFLKEMLEGNGGNMPFGFGPRGTNDAEMQRRLQEMERQVEELHRRFGSPEEPALSEPPPFQPQAEPAELEIPTET